MTAHDRNATDEIQRKRRLSRHIPPEMAAWMLAEGYPSLKALADDRGMQVATVRARLKRGWPWRAAAGLDLPPVRAAVPDEMVAWMRSQGLTCLNAVALRAGIGSGTLRTRLFTLKWPWRSAVGLDPPHRTRGGGRKHNMMIWQQGKHVVYAHLPMDDDAPFYIGSGSTDSGRPFRCGQWRPTPRWQEIAGTGKFRVCILSWHDTPEEARAAEAAAIRRHAPPANMVRAGDDAKE